METLKLNKESVLTAVKNHLFNNSYDKQIEGLIFGLKAGGLKKANGKAAPEADVRKLLSACLDATKINVNEVLISLGLLVKE